MIAQTHKRAILIVLLALVLVLFNFNWVWKWIYPIYYPVEISEAAKRHAIDPNLIIAIIQTESKFKHEKTSKKGAIGLMQLMDETAKWIVESGNYPPYTIDYLYDPKVNIELGSWYLRYLLNQYDGNLVTAIVAYNAGQGNVNKWLKSGQWNGNWNGERSQLSQIPFGETRHFLQRVLYLLDRYEKVYGYDYWEPF